MNPARVRREAVRMLTDLPNVGPATAGDLRLLGIDTPPQLVGRDAWALYAELCLITQQQHDPCVIDVFLSIFNTMAGSYSFLAIFSLPLVTIVIFIYTMATELISVLENKRKAKGAPLYTPEAMNAINEITKVLGVDGVEKLSELIKKQTKPCEDEPKN